VAKLIDIAEEVTNSASGQDGSQRSPQGLSVTAASNPRLTRTGTAMGTAAYMSPEQVRGEPLDGRSDLFSLGAVLYEMASGRPAFKGRTAAVIHEEILKLTPAPAVELNSSLPAGLESIISRALEKDRTKRYQSASELRGDLLRLKAELTSRSSQLSTARVGRFKTKRFYIAAGALLAALVVLAFTIWLRFTTTQSKTRVLPPFPATLPLTGNRGWEECPSFSPDGNQLAYSWAKELGENSDVYVKLIGAGTPLQLTKSRSSSFCPAWSPDGRNIAFRRRTPARDDILLVSALGGPEHKLGESAPIGYD